MTTEEKNKKLEMENAELKNKLKLAQENKLSQQVDTLKKEILILKKKELRRSHKTEKTQFEVEKYKIEIQELKDDVHVLKTAISSQKQQLRIDLFVRFGSRSEKMRKLFNIPKGLYDINPEDPELSDEDKKLLEEAEKIAKDLEDKLNQDDSSESKKQRGKGNEKSSNKKPNKRKGVHNPSKGKQIFDPDYPREDRDHDVNNGFCPKCGEPLVRIGNPKTHEYIELVQKNLKIICEKYNKAYCPNCGVSYDKNGKIIKKDILTPVVEQDRFIPGGLVGNNLLATAVVEKYIYGMSIIRLVKMFQEFEVNISKQNFSNWFLRIGMELEPVAEAMRKSILSFGNIGADETRLQVLREGSRADEKISWIWVLSGYDPKRPAAYYRYDPSRAGKVFKDIIGESYDGYLMTDAYGVYTGKNQKSKYTSCLCMAHLRRKIVDAYKAVGDIDTPRQKSLQTIIVIIGKIFAADSELRKKFNKGLLSEDEFVAKRKDASFPLFILLDKAIMKNSNLKSDALFASAVTYYKNNKEGFSQYLDTPWFSPDNSKSERYVKAAILVRSNSLFAGSPNGARTLSIIETVLQTAYLNNIKLIEYLNYLLEEMTKIRDEVANTVDYSKYLPWNLEGKIKERMEINTISQFDK